MSNQKQNDAFSKENVNCAVEPTSTRHDWNTERYEQVAQIGVGAYGVVFKAKDLQNENGYVAMKCLRVENTEQGMPLSMVREIALLRQLETKEHPNVVRLLDICLGRKTSFETQLMLVFEHIDQDLEMYLRNLPSEELKEEKIASIMRQMLSGIDFLHSMRVVHRDLKPQNILINKSGKIKIADFGLARIYSVDMALTAVVVTLWYRAPEVLLQDSYATPVDLWSVGCIFAELFNKRPLFRGSGDVNQLRRIFDLLGRPTEAEWPSGVAIPITSFPDQKAKLISNYIPRMDSTATDLLLKLIAFNPLLRPSPQEALKHKYFQDKFASETILALDVAEEKKSPAEIHRRRMPYTKSMASDRQHTDENCPLPSTLAANSQWCESDLTTAGTEPSTSRHSNITPALEQVSTEDDSSHDDDHNVAPPIRKRAFGNLLPLNVKDGASGSALAQEDHHETAFLTPPSDLASSTDEDSLSRSSSEESHHSDIHSFLQQQPSGLVLEASDSHPDYITPSSGVDPRPVIRRSRVESESHSRMSWTCDAPTPDATTSMGSKDPDPLLSPAKVSPNSQPPPATTSLLDAKPM